MTLRLCVCVLILLMITLISLQHPLPVLNSENSDIPNYDFSASQYQGRESRGQHVRHKRQAVEEVEGLENQSHNQNLDEKIRNKNNEESDRNKRLETEERGVDRNQYYKSINEETRENHAADVSKQRKGGKFNPKTTSDINSSSKINVANVKRPARQVAEDTHANDAWVFRSGNKVSEGINENLNNGNVVQSLKNGNRREREIPEMVDAQHLSPESLETMRKINPLTIGDQVSQMIHNRKCNTKNKVMSKSSFGAGPLTIQKEAHVVETSNCMPQENDDVSKKQAASDKQNAQRVIQKPCPSNDYGFSVIILAGDPLKMVGSGARSENEGKECKNMKQKPKTCGGDNTEDQSRGKSKTNDKNTNTFSELCPKKEARVPKNPNAKAEFPMYDEDLTSVPDPLNGLLDDNYWVDPFNKEDSRLVLGGVKRNPLHRIHVRGVQKMTNNRNSVHYGSKDKCCNTNGNVSTNGAKNCLKVGNSFNYSGDATDTTDPTVNSSDDPPDTNEEESFSDMIINLNNTNCQSYGIYNGNNSNNSNTNNINNKKSVTY